MTAPIQLPAPGQHLQRLRRVYRTFTDQHGRRFGAQADAASNQPIGEFQPLDCRPPWTPPMRFAKFAQDGDLFFRWDYQSMADELSAEVASYYEAVTKWALEHSLPVPEVGGTVDRRLQALYGRPPLSPEIPIAASMGDPWLLGAPGAEKDADLAAILQQGTSSTGNDALRAIKERVEHRLAGKIPPTPASTDAAVQDGPITYQTFMAEGRSRGLSMADISLAWKAHKDALVEAA